MIRIRTDSSKIKNGDIFVALKGISKDGHGFIKNAIDNGAVRIIAEHGEYSVDTVIVPDTRKYLVNYLDNHYRSLLEEMTFIGITGTNGKTTTSFLIYQALNKLGIKCSYIGTIGYYKDDKVCNLSNTSPDVADLYELIIDSYKSGYKYIVMEVSSQGLAHHRFDGIDFDYALFTNLTQDHLDYHVTMENYLYTKQSLFKKLREGGRAIVNIDDSYSGYYLLDENTNITFGFNDSDYQIVSNFNLDNNLIFDYVSDDIKHSVISNLIGEHNLYNLMGVICILREIGFSHNKIINVIPTLLPPPGRMEKIDFGSNMIIIDYAHTPDAIDNILKATSKFTKGSIYVVFGCTGDRDRKKRPIMTRLVLSMCNKAIITSDDVHNEDIDIIINDMTRNIIYDNYDIELDRKLAIKKGIGLLDKDDTLLILGKGHEEYMIIGNQKIPYSDRDTILECIREIDNVTV